MPIMDQQEDRQADWLDIGIDSGSIPELDTVLKDHPVLAVAVAHLPILAALGGSWPDPLIDSRHG